MVSDLLPRTANTLLGPDIYRGFGALWVALDLAFSRDCAGAGAVDRAPPRPCLAQLTAPERLADDIPGCSLAAAMGHLDEITRFEGER